MTMYTVKGCNIRQGASTEYDVIGTFSKGEAVKVSGKVNEVNWYEISLSEDKKGYVSGSLLVSEKPAEEQSVQPPQQPSTEQTQIPEQTTDTPNTTDANGEQAPVNPNTGEVMKPGDSWVNDAGVETVYADDDWLYSN